MKTNTILNSVGGSEATVISEADFKNCFKKSYKVETMMKVTHKLLQSIPDMLVINMLPERVLL